MKKEGVDGQKGEGRELTGQASWSVKSKRRLGEEAGSREGGAPAHGVTHIDL